MKTRSTAKLERVGYQRFSRARVSQLRGRRIRTNGAAAYS
jgi:hypothetical protein